VELSFVAFHNGTVFTWQETTGQKTIRLPILAYRDIVHWNWRYSLPGTAAVELAALGISLYSYNGAPVVRSDSSNDTWTTAWNLLVPLETWQQISQSEQMFQSMLWL